MPATSKAKPRGSLAGARSVTEKPSRAVTKAPKPSIVTILPPQLLQLISCKVDPDVWLPLKLTRKTFAALMPDTAQDVIEDAISSDHKLLTHIQSAYDEIVRIEVEQIIWRMERTRPSTKLKNLLCTVCHHMKPDAEFVDDQKYPVLRGRKKSTFLFLEPEIKAKRCCISCGILSKEHHYSQQDSITIGDLASWVCHCCRNVHPIDPLYKGHLPADYVMASPNIHGAVFFEHYGAKLCEYCDARLKAKANTWRSVVVSLRAV